ncbi:MAG: hypothetical protein ACWGIK_11100 [Achromobacter pulmonis]
MATDARLAVGLATHPKTKKLVRRLGGDGAWRLVCLFLWCAANRPDGNLTGLSDEDIELAVDWAGGEGELVATLRDVGFLDGDEYCRTLHDWEEHNPWVAGSEARSEKARWAALCKKYGRNEAARRMPEYAERIGGASGEGATECRAQAAGTSTAVPKSANSVPVVVPKSASGMPLAESGTAPSPSPSPSPKENSEAKASGAADAPPEPPPAAGMTAQEAVWALGVPLLTAAGQAEKAARSVLGKWVKGYGPEAVREAIVRCAEQQVVEPVSWIIAALGTPSAGRRAADGGGAGQAQPPGSPLDIDPNPPWLAQTGYASVWEAISDGCTEHTFRQFRDGKRIPREVTA